MSKTNQQLREQREFSLEAFRKASRELRDSCYTDPCKICKETTYEKDGGAEWCSSGFHLCRDCIYEDGVVFYPCEDHEASEDHPGYQRIDRYPIDTIGQIARLWMIRYLKVSGVFSDKDATYKDAAWNAIDKLINGWKKLIPNKDWID
jgi:hypothetical protein